MIIWRGVVGYEDYYRVSDDGQIWSIRSNRLLATPVSKSRGRMEWTPKVNGSSQTLTVHQTVAHAFLGEPNGRQVRHKNGNPLDNRLSNLEYGTAKQNSDDRRKPGYQGAKLLTAQQQLDIQAKSRAGQRTQSLADEYKVSYNAINELLEKKQTEVTLDTLWECVKTGAGIAVIGQYLQVDHTAVSQALKKHFKPMRQLRREYPLNRSISVGMLQQLIENKK